MNQKANWQTGLKEMEKRGKETHAKALYVFHGSKSKISSFILFTVALVWVQTL